MNSIGFTFSIISPTLISSVAVVLGSYTIPFMVLGVFVFLCVPMNCMLKKN